MSPIDLENTFTQVVIFETDGPAQQEKLIGGVVPQVDAWVRTLPGFISATFLQNLDGERVINVAKWLSRLHWEALDRDPRAHSLREAVGSAEVRGDPRGYSIAAAIFATQENPS